jgi:hypothetical protein
MSSLTDILESYRDAIDANAIVAGKRIAVEHTNAGTVIHVQDKVEDPEFVAVKFTADKDADNLYTGDVYGNGTQNVATATGVKIGLHGMDIDIADPQWFWTARQTLMPISGVLTQVYEVFPNLPKLPDLVNNYTMMAVAGKVKWVLAGPCP